MISLGAEKSEVKRQENIRKAFHESQKLLILLICD
jgi:hypothetical protein